MVMLPTYRSIFVNRIDHKSLIAILNANTLLLKVEEIPLHQINLISESGHNALDVYKLHSDLGKSVPCHLPQLIVEQEPLEENITQSLLNQGCNLAIG